LTAGALKNSASGGRRTNAAPEGGFDRAALELLRGTPAFLRVKKDAEAGRTGHAYLIVSKDTEASAMLAALCMAYAEDIGERRLDRFFKNGFADICAVPAEGAEVKARDVAALTETAYLTPYELKHKFYVISHAETMNEAAQNKLLKLLEEPPKSVVLLLKCANPYRLLPTVLSRCCRVDIPLFSADRVYEAIRDPADEPGERAYLAAALSNGSIQAARAMLADPGVLELFDTVMDGLLRLKTSRDVLSVSNALFKTKAEPEQMTGLIDLILGDCLLYNEQEKVLMRFKTRHKEIGSLVAGGFTARAVLEIRPALIRAAQRLRFYGNALSVIEELLFTIVEVKAKCQLL
jgi:DNA polymerase-3 subunit delta'